MKIAGKIFLGILIFLLLVVLFVRSPWGQDIIKNQLISTIEKNTGAEIELEKVFIQFDGDIQIDQLFIKDPKGDTLVYTESISANIALWPLIQGNSFGLNELEGHRLRANIIRKDSINGFNYEFLMDAFGATDTTQTAPPADTTAAPMEINIGDIDLT